MNSWPHSLERPAALLNVSAVFGRVGQVEFEHVAEGEVGDAPHEAALAPERRHRQVLGVDGATWKVRIGFLSVSVGLEKLSVSSISILRFC